MITISEIKRYLDFMTIPVSITTLTVWDKQNLIGDSTTLGNITLFPNESIHKAFVQFFLDRYPSLKSIFNAHPHYITQYYGISKCLLNRVLTELDPDVLLYYKR